MSPTPVLVGLWADSVGVEKAELALLQSHAVLSLAAATPEPLSSEFLHYREHNDNERVKLKAFFTSLATVLEACIEQMLL